MATTAPSVRLAGLLADAEARHVPLSVLLEITHRCNLDCVHCYLGHCHHPGPSQRELSTGEMVRLLDELAQAGTFFLTLTGGEIMVRADWLEIAREARRRGFALKLFTAGTLVDAGTADAIRDLRPLAVEISLYGSTAEIHERVTRRPGSHRKTIRAVQLLAERGVPTVIKAPLMTANSDDYPNVIRLAETWGVGWYFDPQITPQNDNDRSPRRMCLSFEDTARIWGDPRLGKSPAPADCQVDESRLRGGPCSAARRMCAIGPYGDVYPCAQLLRPAGNLREQPFAEIWQCSEWMNRIRGLTLASLKGCGACPALPHCAPCLGLSLLESDNLDGPSPTRCRAGLARFAAHDPAGWEAHGRLTA